MAYVNSKVGDSCWCKQLGVSRQAVSKWENGATEPSTSNLFALAKLFGVPIEEFMKEIQI